MLKGPLGKLLIVWIAMVAIVVGVTEWLKHEWANAPTRYPDGRVVHPDGRVEYPGGRTD